MIVEVKSTFTMFAQQGTRLPVFELVSTNVCASNSTAENDSFAGTINITGKNVEEC